MLTSWSCFSSLAAAFHHNHHYRQELYCNYNDFMDFHGQSSNAHDRLS